MCLKPFFCLFDFSVESRYHVVELDFCMELISLHWLLIIATLQVSWLLLYLCCPIILALCTVF